MPMLKPRRGRNKSRKDLRKEKGLMAAARPGESAQSEREIKRETE